MSVLAWAAHRLVDQLGDGYAAKQVQLAKQQSMAPLSRDIGLAQKMADSPLLKEWAQAEGNAALKARALAEMESYRRSFRDKSYFFAIAASGHYYFNDTAGQYTGKELRYTLDSAKASDGWYFATIGSGQDYQINVNRDEHLNVTKVWINVLMKEGDRVLGVIGTGIDLTTFIQEIIESGEQDTTNLFVDASGAIQAHKQTSMIDFASLTKQEGEKTTLFPLFDFESDRQALRQAMKRLSENPDKAEVLDLFMGGSEHLVGLTYLPEIRWFAISILDVGKYAERGSIIAVILLFALALLGSFAASAGMVNRLVLKRVARLEASAGLLSQGNFELEFQSGPADEIGRLADSFKLMARRLRDYTRDLESRVAERTAELSLVLKKVQSSEHRYRTLFSGSRAVMLLIDPTDGSIIEANAAASRYYGYDVAKMKGMNISEINLQSKEMILENMSKAFLERASTFIFKHRLASGEIRDVEVHSGPIELENRFLLFSIIHDITDRSALEAERKLLMMAVEQSPISIVVANPEGNIEYANPAFSVNTGYSREEVYNQNPRILKSGHTSDEEYKAIWDELTTGKPWKGVFLNKRKDGTLFWEQAQISPVFDSQGHISNYIGIKENISKRIEDEARLKNSEQRYRATFEQAAVGIIHTAFDGQFLQANQRFCDLVGYSKDEIEKMSWKDITPPEDVALSHASIEMLLSGNIKSTSWEKRYIRKDETFIWVRLTASLQSDATGAPAHFLVIAEDITSRRVAEKALKESVQEFHGLITSIPVGVYKYRVHNNGEARFDFVSPRWCELFGLSPDAVYKDPSIAFSFIYPEDREELIRKSAAKDTHANSFIWTGRFLRQDGTTLWLHIEATSSIVDNGDILWNGIVSDVSERKRADDVISTLNRRLQDILSAASEIAIIAMDMNGIINLYNAGAHRMLGYTEYEVIGKQTLLLFHDPDEIAAREQELSEEFGRKIAGFDVFKTKSGILGRECREWTFIREDGHRINVSLQVTPVYSADHQIYGYLGIATDISSRVKAEKEMSQQAGRYKALLSAASDGIHILDEDGKLVEASASFYEMLGYTRAEAHSLSIKDWDHQHTEEELKTLIPELINSPRLTMDTKYVRNDGREIDVEVLCHGLKMEDRSYLYASARDITERKVVQDILRETMNRLESVLDTTEEGIIGTDEDGEVTFANRAARSILGWPSQEAMHYKKISTVFGHLLADERPCGEGVCQIRSALNEGKTHRISNEYFIRQNGRKFPVEYVVSPLMANMKVRGIVVVFHDITERKEVENQLKESEERFRFLIEGTTDWVWETDRDHRVSWLSPSFGEVLKIPPEFPIGKFRWDLASPTHEIDAAIWQAHIEDLKAHRNFRDFRYWINAGKSNARWISISGSPRYDSDGKFFGYRGTGTDITSMAESAMRIKMLSTVVEQSPLSVVITDPNGTIEYSNSYFSALTGFSQEEVLGKNCRIFASGETSSETYREMWKAISAGKRWAGELKNKKKSGALHWEMLAISPIINDEGKIEHYISLKEDVSYRREAEVRIAEANRMLQDQAIDLERSNKELEQFAYVASHDLRQPLRMVSSYLTLIERKLGADLTDDMKTYIGFAVGGAKKMDALIRDLLEYSRVGRSEIEPETVDLTKVVEETLFNLKVAIEEASAIVTVEGSMPVVVGNPVELGRLFQNLIGNAVKYRAPDRQPRIDIGCNDSASEWTIWIKDNGIGLDPKDHERAFGIFQRLVPKEAYEGTGIGLAVCKKIVESHGGRIWIESVAGEGSTFLVALPKSAGLSGDRACGSKS
ncbi:MAG: PAS domain S-box protein [Alphaproteobacteria bacterium]|nr:PAS domain S-box protein [Alphaproteobacteria bacterium]